MGKDINKAFGNNLYNLRIKCGLTQEALGFEVDVSNRAIGYYESGQRFPDLKTLDKLARVLGVEIKDLFDFK